MNTPVCRGSAAPCPSFVRLLLAGIACITILALAACSSSGGGDGKKDTEEETTAEEEELTGLMLVGWESSANDARGDDGDLLFARSTDGGATWSDPAVLNSNAASDTVGGDNGINFATDGNGTWIAVWKSDEDGDFDIYYARSTDDGLTWSAPQTLNDNANADTQDDEDPDIVTDGQGKWIVAWEAATSFGSNLGVYYATSSDNGGSWNPTQTLSNGDISQVNVTLSTNRSGGWVAVWEADVSDADMDVVASFSEDAGQIWTSRVQITSDGSMNDTDAHLETDGNGAWIAVWVHNNGGGDLDIWFARSTDNGTSWSSPAALHSHFDSDGTASDSEINHNSMATDGAGTWVAVWQSDSNLAGTTGDLDILFSRSTDNGASWSAPARLNSDAATDSVSDLSPSVSYDATGRWVAAWHAARLEGGIGGETDLFRAVSTDGGTTWSAPVALNSTAASDGLAPILDTAELDEDAVLKAK